MSTLSTRPVGLETAFSIQLASGAPVLRGLCVVKEVFSTASNRYGRPGIKLEIVRLTRESTDIYVRLQQYKPPTGSGEPRREAAPTSPPEAVSSAEIALPSLPDVPPTPPAVVAIPPPTPRAPTHVPPRPTAPIPVPRPKATPAGVPTTTVEIPALKPPDTRTPGSEYILPANPLMNLTDASLVGFVECTLYEETSKFPIDETTPVPTAEPEAPVAALELPLVATPIVTAAPVAPAPVAPPALAPALAVPPPIPVAAPPAVPLEPALAHPVTATTAPTPRVTAIVPHRRRAPRIAIAIAGVAVLVTGGILVAAQTRSSGDSSSEPERAPDPPRDPVPATAPVPDPAPSSGATVTPEPAPTAPVPTARTEPEPPPAPDDGPPVIGKGPCRTTIVSTPAGANVAVDGEAVGPTPLAIAGPCKPRRVDVSHARYAAATRQTNPVAGTPETLDVTLVRPTHALTVVTQPPGAIVSIDGRRAGTSPTVVKVMGFQSFSLTVEKPGYTPVTRRVYSKVAEDRLVVPLAATPLFLPKKKK